MRLAEFLERLTLDVAILGGGVLVVMVLLLLCLWYGAFSMCVKFELLSMFGTEGTRDTRVTYVADGVCVGVHVASR